MLLFFLFISGLAGLLYEISPQALKRRLLVREYTSNIIKGFAKLLKPYVDEFSLNSESNRAIMKPL
jgi:hypothetical protein